MKFHIKFFFLGFFLLLSLHAGAQGQEELLGEITLKIDDGPKTKYPIKQALLYRNVSIDYDSTILLQSSKSIKVLYYPQLDQGEENVLRLIVERKMGRKSDFYDFFINVGDSLQDSLYWENERGRIFLAHRGEVWPTRAYAENVRGEVVLVESKSNRAVTGSLHLNFDLPGLSFDRQAHHFQVEGTFDVPVGSFRETSLSTATVDRAQKQKYRNNLYLALGLTLVILVLFGFK